MTLENFLLTKHRVNVLGNALDKENYLPIDLSENQTKQWQIEFSNSSECWDYMRSILSKNNVKVLFGGYLEKRNLYQRSELFNSSLVSNRNIHLGIDLWTAVETPVLAALAGTVFGFANNLGLGNYGGTIILKHEIQHFSFFTLYGHLSKKSLINLKVGTVFLAGETIGFLGDATENGDYAPHLHFQIIKNIGDNKSDYPGVCSAETLSFYKENCPDPNLLLKL